MRDLTEQEKSIMKLLGDAYNGMVRLPQIHLSCAREFEQAIHVAQNIILARPGTQEMSKPPGKIMPEQIMRMPAGEDIDDLVAVHVMGWKSTDCRMRFPDVKAWYCVGDDGVAPSPGWSPSTDIKDAWEVVEFLDGKPYSFRVSPHAVYLYREPDRIHCVHHLEGDAPLAICRAALLIAQEKNRSL